MHKYFPGEILPPHLSPFMKEERRIGDYVPPEEKKLGLDDKEKGEDDQTEVVQTESESDTKSDEMDSEANEATDGEESKEEECEDEGDPNMSVVEGKPQNLNKGEDERLMEDEQYRLRVMMIRRKHRGLYRSMMKARKKRVHESKQLERKRKMYDGDKNSIIGKNEKVTMSKKKKDGKSER